MCFVFIHCRIHRHARSSSLDLNKLKLNIPVPPEIPPRISPQITAQISLDAQLDMAHSQFADFTHFPESVVEVTIISYTVESTTK